MQNSKKITTFLLFSVFFFFFIIIIIICFALAAVQLKGHTGHTLAEYEYTAIIIGS